MDTDTVIGNTAPPHPSETFTDGDAKSRRAMVALLQNELALVGQHGAQSIRDLLWRLRGTVDEPQILVRFPAADAPDGPDVEDRLLPLREGLKLLASDENPEYPARMARKATADSIATTERERQRKEAAWLALPSAARAAYRLAYSGSTSHRQVLLELARAIAKEAEQANNVPPFVYVEDL